MTTKAEQILIRKAMDLVWQNPRKDRQSIIEMARISPKNGYRDLGKVLWEVVETPTVDGFYHFYQLGDNFPGDYNLFSDKYQWYRLSDWCKEVDLVIHLYNKYGKLIPVNNSYAIRLYNDNIIVAVLQDKSIVDLNEDKLYMHFYLNHFYRSEMKDTQEEHIEYHVSVHKPKKSSVWLLNVRNMFNLRHQGKTALFHQGYLVDQLDIDKVQENETTELYYDQSIRKIVDIPVSSLRTFRSDLDEKHKYLIHPPKDNIECIDYRDDVDIFVYKKDKITKHIKGLYYHRNQEDAVRMVTHRDYSLPVPYVMSYIEQLDNNPDLNDFYIRLYVRDNGHRKPLIEDVNMIKSLYRLPDDKIYEAMIAVDSTLPEWQANNLESSAYTGLMRSYYEELDLPLILKAFGYTSIVNAIANPNIMVTLDPNGNYFKIPEGLIPSCTIFEYSGSGLLLGWWYHQNQRKYYPRNEDCVFIEAMAGHGQDELTIHTGVKDITLERNTAYRFYKSPVKKGNAIRDWVDVTGDSSITINDTQCHFEYNPVKESTIVLGDNKFLCYEQELDGSDGVYDFRLTYGKMHSVPLEIPPGKIDLWLNGHALVEGIDYWVDFPNVCIVSKDYVNDENALQRVTIRCTGFPMLENGVLKRITSREYAYVENGKISVNKHHDVHSDRILRTVIDGGVFDPSVVPFQEDGTANARRISDDGKPYAVETPYVALVGTLNINLYSAQLKDYDLNRRVGDYLTSHLPHPVEGKPPVIKDKYNLYSPFLSRIVADIKHGRLLSPQIGSPVNIIDKVVDKYKRLLTLDPCYRGYSEEFANVHPHNQKYVIEMNNRDVAFLEKLNELYLNKKVDMTQFFNVRKSK